MRLSESERAAVADVDDNCLTEYLEDEADDGSLTGGDNRCAATRLRRYRRCSATLTFLAHVPIIIAWLRSLCVYMYSEMATWLYIHVRSWLFSAFTSCNDC